MTTLYTATQITHLFCACVVIGYLVYDIFIFSAFKKIAVRANSQSLKESF